MSSDVPFQCARCWVELEPSGGELRCAQCGTRTPLYEGIPRFAGNTEYYFGEIPREAMLELAASVDRLGWDAAFQEVCDGQEAGLRDYIRQYIADASRANWKYLLQLPENGTVLDFGCGWGETTLSLARSVRRVVSMDLTLERLLVLRARARDLRLNHTITFAHGGDVLPLPFRDELFDAVVLNGVLEWVPVTGEGDPRQCQLAMLRELRRIVRPTGQLYIGIENRVGLKYFLGRIDEHSHMKYTSLLPRSLASMWSRARRKADYRTYTYSRRGYAKLLKEAGFTQADFYCPYPDYREFGQIVPVTTRDVKQLFQPTAAWKRVALRMPGCPQFLKWAVPSFAIVAGTAQPGASRLRSIVTEVSSRIGINCHTPTGYHSRPLGEVLLYCATATDTSPTILLRIAETQTAIDACFAAARHLESLWERCSGMGPCMHVVPRSKGRGFLQGAAFTAEEVKNGVSWQRIDDYRRAPGRAVLAAAGWLVCFQQATKTNAIWDPGNMHARAAALAESVQRVLPQSQETRSDVDETPERVGEDDSLSAVPAVVCHGDFHLDNLLFSPADGRLTGVVDWDLGSLHGLPLTDLIILLIAYGMDVRGQTYCKTVQSLLEPSTLHDPERTALSQYETAFALDTTYRTYAIRVAVLQNIVTLSARRPEAFRRLEDDFIALPPWLLHATTVPADVGSPTP